MLPIDSPNISSLLQYDDDFNCYYYKDTFAYGALNILPYERFANNDIVIEKYHKCTLYI